ncbi:MAG: hypothetical protein GXO48_01065, partial [Chlorobi bacterium]|nr:hypothetical protein [Chlorobiota bacterium]
MKGGNGLLQFGEEDAIWKYQGISRVSALLTIFALMTVHAQNIGVGTTNPQSRLHVTAPSGYTLPLLQVEKDGAPNPYLIVRQDGRIGIGIVNPSEALDVSGNIQFSG